MLQMCFNAFDKAADLDVLSHPILNFLYYLVRLLSLCFLNTSCNRRIIIGKPNRTVCLHANCNLYLKTQNIEVGGGGGGFPLVELWSANA